MINLNNITKTDLYGTFKGMFSDNVPKVLANAPLSSYTKPLDQLRQNILSRANSFDALNTAFTSIPELYEQAANVAIDGHGVKPETGTYFDISDDSINIFCSAIKQVGSRIDDDHYEICLTSAVGLVYKIQISYSEQLDLWAAYYKDIYGGQTSLITYVQRDNTLIGRMRFWAEPTNFRDTTVRESFLEIVRSLVQSAELNIAIADTCGSIIKGRFQSFISSLDFASKTAPVRKFFNQIASAFASGGLKGVIFYIFSYIKGISTLSGEDGVLQFTDNNKLRPAEYIAGFVSTIITSITGVVALIIAIFNPIIAAVSALVGSVLWSVIGSFRYDVSNTRASYITSDVFDDTAIIDSVPLATWQGEFLASLVPWYQDYYNRGDSILCVDVPGGQLFIGPGAFDENNNNTVTYIRYEFHPLLSPVRLRYRFAELMADYVVGVYTTENLNQFKLLDCWNDVSGSTSIMTIWQDLLDYSKYSSEDYLTNTDDGVLSGEADRDIRINIWISLWCFIMNVFFSTDDVANAVSAATTEQKDLITRESDVSDPNPHGWTNSTSGTFATFVHCVMQMIPYLVENPDLDRTSYMTPTVVDAMFDWDHIISGFISINDTITNLMYCPLWIEHSLGVYTYLAGIGFPFASNLLLESKRQFLGIPYSLPDSFRYGLSMPKYNASTFYHWIAMAITTTVLITTATVIATVSTIKFIKHKRASNLSAFNDAQSTYQDAQNGIKTVVDEHGEIHQIAFDVNSDEGKEYIAQSWKKYKKIAFRNNLWQKIIGGSRYDVSSFWGEADNNEEVSEAFQASSFQELYTQPEDESTTNTFQDIPVLAIRNLIVGSE